MKNKNITAVDTRTIEWQCNGCDHLCKLLLDSSTRPKMIIECPNKPEWAAIPPRTIEEQATFIPDKRFIGVHAVTLRMLNELKRPRPSSKLLQAFISSIDIDLDELIKKGIL